MLLLFKEVICSTATEDVKYVDFAVDAKDIKRVYEGGIIISTNENYSEIVVENYSEGDLTTTHKIVGNVPEIVSTINNCSMFANIYDTN